jgi:beta propeller repeat protein
MRRHRNTRPFGAILLPMKINENGGDPDIYLYNTLDQTEIALTQDPNTSAKYPDIYESRVVWQDNRSGDWDIFTYNTPTPLPSILSRYLHGKGIR